MIGIVHALRQDTGPAPDERLAGLSLVLRAVLTAQQQGARRIIVLLRPGDDMGALDARVRVPLTTLVIDGPLSEALRAEVDAEFLLLRHDVIADASIYRDLRASSNVVATRGGASLGLLHARPEMLADLSTLAPLEVGARFAIEIRDDDDRRRAVDALFESCRKPVDGLVSRYLNRHISLFVSRRLVNTPITPNQMTVATFAVGVLAAYVASRGGYRDTLAAAALMQLNSILDGCDGELARVRFQGSRLGEWLDTIGDDFSNVLYWGGLAIGARTLAQHGDFLSAAGWVAAGANALAALLNYRKLWGLGTGDLNALLPRPSGGLGAAVALVLKQDFFLLFLLGVAVTGYLHYVLPAVAVGALVTLGAAIVGAQRAQRAKSK
jgi:phosphatidylglycerophosphate synthase